jgi:hypothetical protein
VKGLALGFNVVGIFDSGLIADGVCAEVSIID